MGILTDSSYEKIHTGSAIEIQHLQAALEHNNIKCIVRDDNESAKLAGYALASDQTRLLVLKEDVIRAKHIVSTTLEQFDQHKITDSELEELSQNTKEKPKITYTTRPAKANEKPPKISKARALFYVAFICLSSWRLSPLLYGEELSITRIIISSGFLVFSIVMLIKFFRQ